MQMPAPGPPLIVEVTRGPMIESRHRGSAAIVDARGRPVAVWGDAAQPVYPRSAVKCLQALPLVESGAADAFGLGDDELALACASHNGEPVHTEAVAAWLERIGLGDGDLECGVHMPFDKATARAMVLAGVAPSTLHNNCSGKHAGFLTVARHLAEPTAFYVRNEHPVQRRIRDVLGQMTGLDLGAAPTGTDGCAIPTIAVPLAALAHAMARLADPSGLPDGRAAAVLRLRAAWGGGPYMVAGRDRFDTAAMLAGGGGFMVKGGAEGVCCMVLPEQGLGIALKIDDGAERAVGVAASALLRHAGALDEAAWRGLHAFAQPTIANRRGDPVGTVRPAAGFPAA